jgi:hypothetical protein
VPRARRQESCHDQNRDPICHGSTPIDPCGGSPSRPSEG